MGLAGGSSTTGEPWQSGNRVDYVVLFLQQPGLICFLPFIMFSMAAMAAVVWNPSNVVKYGWVRIGLYTGALVSLQFLIAVFLTSHVITLLAAGITGPCLALAVWGVSEIVKRIKRFTILHLMIGTAVVAVLTATLISIGEPIYGFMFAPLFFIFVAAPTLNATSYLRMAILAGCHESKSMGKIAGMIAAIIVWSGGFFIAWRYAIQRVLDEYQYLPTTNPNCFVASAAAHGNSRLVKSTLIQGQDGPVLLNPQMQRLKFLELALQSSLPRLHGAIRSVYNRIGPPLAAVCKASPLLASAAYLLLKPLELVAMIVRKVSGISAERVKRIYRQ